MKNRFTRLGAFVPVLALLSVPVSAQEPEPTAEMASMMEAYEKAGTPGAAHEALARTAGTWTATVKMWMEPGAEPTVTEVTSVIEPVMGGRFMRETVEGEFMGQPFRGVSVVGVDNTTGEARGVWYDNHSTALYFYRGRLDEAGGELTLGGEYRDPATGERVKTRSLRTMQGDTMVDTGWESRDGVERKSMEIVYRRQP
jgi:hypothetical protein